MSCESTRKKFSNANDWFRLFSCWLYVVKLMFTKYYTSDVNSSITFAIHWSNLKNGFQVAGILDQNIFL